MVETRGRKSEYDFDYIQNELKSGRTFVELAVHYKRDKSSISRWYKKEKSLRLAKQVHGPTALVGTGNASLGKYGTKPPTLYISPLNHDDWTVKYCGAGYQWRLPHLTEMRNSVWSALVLLVLEPRGYGKTLAMIGLFCRWILEKRLPLLCITAGAGANRKIFRAVKQILESDTVREDYGDILDQANQTTFEMVLVPEIRTPYPDAVFKVIGRGGQMIGLHPFWIHLEDIIQEEFKNDESNEDVERWFNEVLKYLGIQETKFTATGTRRSLDDFYVFLMKQGWDVLWKKAIDLLSGRYPAMSDVTMELINVAGITKPAYSDIDISVGTYKVLECPNWPLKRLLLERTKDTASFESQMQNNPLPETGLYFDKDDWIEALPPHLTAFAGTFQSVDIAYKRFKASDNACIMVAGINDGTLWILDGVYGKITIDDMLTYLKDFNNQYGISLTFMETNFRQVLIANRAEQEGILNIKDVDQNTNKIMRIDALRVHFKAKRIKVSQLCPIKDSLYAEYLQYNQQESTRSRKDDGLDALTMLLENTSYYLTVYEPSWFN